VGVILKIFACYRVKPIAKPITQVDFAARLLRFCNVLIVPNFEEKERVHKPYGNRL
jgi:hypothetical protein